MHQRVLHGRIKALIYFVECFIYNNMVEDVQPNWKYGVLTFICETQKSFLPKENLNKQE